MTEKDLERVEKRLKAINAFAPIKRCCNSKVDITSVLNIKGFDLKRTLEMDPEFLDTDAEHEHDESVTSMSIRIDGALDLDEMEKWMGNLLRTKGADIFRMKGVLSIEKCSQKFVYQVSFKWSLTPLSPSPFPLSPVPRPPLATKRQDLGKLDSLLFPSSLSSPPLPSSLSSPPPPPSPSSPPPPPPSLPPPPPLPPSPPPPLPLPQGVHMIFAGGFDEEWKEGEKRESKLVFIGKNLEKEKITAEFKACVATAELRQKKIDALRFKKGDKVLCNAKDGWHEGTVVDVLYHEEFMPMGFVAPYQVKLDEDGKLIFVPVDSDEVCRKA